MQWPAAKKSARMSLWFNQERRNDFLMCEVTAAGEACGGSGSSGCCSGGRKGDGRLRN